MIRPNANYQTRVGIHSAVKILLMAGLLSPRVLGQDDATEPDMPVRRGDELESLRKSERRQRLLAESRLYALQIAAAKQRFENGNIWWAREALDRTDEKMRRFEYGWLQTLFNWGQQKVDLGYHHEPITGLACSPDGQRIATSFKGSITIWDATTLKPVTTLSDHSVFAFSPDSKHLLSGGLRGGLQIWDVETGRVVRELVGHAKAINDAEFSADGKRIVSAGADKSAWVWDFETGDEIDVLRGHRDEVHCVAFSPDGKWVATGSRDLRIWNAVTGAVRHTIQTAGTDVMAVAFSPDGKQVLNGNWDAGGKPNQYVELWDAETGKSIHSYPDFENRINSLVFAPDGQTFAAGGYEKHIRICSVMTGQEIRRLPGYMLMVNHLSYLPQENRLVSTSGGEIRVWNMRNPKPPIEVQSPSMPQFGPKGDWIATRNDAVIELRDAHSVKVRQTLGGHTDRVTDVEFHPDGHRLASASEDCTLRIWNTASGEKVLISKTKGPAESIQWSPQGAWILSRERVGEEVISVRIWNAATGKHVADVPPKNPKSNGFAFSPDDMSYVCPDPGNTIHVRDVAKGEKRVQLEGENKDLAYLVFSPSGDRIAGVFKSWPWVDIEYLKVWDAKTGKVLFAIRGRTDGYTHVAFSADGNRVVMPFGRNVRSWDARTGKDLHDMYGHTDQVNDARYFPEDSQRIVTSSLDGTVKIWNADIGEELLTLPHGETPYVSVNHDGTRILSATRNDTRPVSFNVKLWKSDGWMRKAR